MSADIILEEWASKQGWSESAQIAILLEYIGNQGDDAAFEDFLACQAAEENGLDIDLGLTPEELDALADEDALRVTAKIITDDGAVCIGYVGRGQPDWQAPVDVTGLFATMNDDEFRALESCGWGGGYPADAVAEWAADHDARVDFVFRYTENVNPGYDCYVDPFEARRWLRTYRPELADELNIHLCQVEECEAVEDIEASPCGSFCQEHLADHARECGACAHATK